ncbi:MAG: ankyrin repeat domain-containing protein [Acidobacteriia bacterium]|nr:ankyrin repeat domain-containing protein [Terriglobia bacterium]
MAETAEPLAQFKRAVANGDAPALTRLLETDPRLKANLNDPLFSFDTPAVVIAASRDHRGVIDVLLDAGADVNARSKWWAGSFGVLDLASAGTSAYLIQRGAILDAHAASRLGMFDRLQELISADPALVHARGGDGQTPLHFASTVEIAGYLLDRGADIDARDVDHESTPAQYLVASHPEVVRYLIGCGAKADLFLAAAVGDAGLARRHLDADPESIRARVNEDFFPKQDPRSGGTIYIWTLGMNRSPHQVARKFGHPNVLELLMDRSPADVKSVEACLDGDRASLQALLASHPDLVSKLDQAGRRHVSDAAQDNNLPGVRLMLEYGWPVEGSGGVTPLHWAAFHGNAEMVREILRYSPPLDQADPQFHATPLGWAIHGSEHGWHRDTGNYAAAVEALLRAGAAFPEKIEGSQAVRQALTSNQRPRSL